jgi:hypothetical protein
MMKYLAVEVATKMCFRGAGCKCAVMVVNSTDRGFEAETWFQFAFCTVL